MGDVEPTSYSESPLVLLAFLQSYYYNNNWNCRKKIEIVCRSVAAVYTQQDMRTIFFFVIYYNKQSFVVQNIQCAHVRRDYNIIMYRNAPHTVGSRPSPYLDSRGIRNYITEENRALVYTHVVANIIEPRWKGRF